MKEEVNDKVVEVRMVNDRVMSLAIAFKEVVRGIYDFAPQS